MYQLLLECYLSGQMLEAEWQSHLCDNVFCEWLKQKGVC